VRVVAKIDGQEIRTARADRIRQAMDEIDDNRDGVIDETERAAHPRALRSLGIAEKWNDLLPLIDRAPQDQRIQTNEIGELLVQRFGPAVTLVGRVGRGNQAVELFDLLDVDQDQRLTEAELASLSTRLSKLDADGDDAFSVIEVEPFRNPFGQTPNNMTSQVDLPWAICSSASERLISRFDVNPRDGSLSADEIGQPPALIATVDVDQNGKLSSEELKTWLLTPPVQFMLTTNSFRRKAGRMELSWETIAAPGQNAARSDRKSAKDLDVLLTAMPLQLRMATAVRTRTQDTITFYRNQFRRADADKNKYLDSTEFNMLSALGVPFDTLDADGNGQLYEPELIDYLSIESSSEQSRVILSFNRNEQSLFSLLDRNNDRRLTERESISTFDRWQAFDYDGDRILNRSELSGNMKLVIELPKPRLFQEELGRMGEMSREPVIQTQRDGPLWFQGMDRNRDGDISRREFLGTEAQFKKWDRDGDGLISKSEAM